MSSHFKFVNLMYNEYTTKFELILKSNSKLPYYFAKKLGLDFEKVERFLLGTSSPELNKLIYNELGIDESILNEIKLEKIDEANSSLKNFYNDLLESYNIVDSDIRYELPIYSESDYSNGINSINLTEV